MNNIDEVLVKLRKEKGVTQVELADFLGVTDKTVSKWETGVVVPDTIYLTDIAKFYNITVDQLLGNNAIKPQSEKKHSIQEFILAGLIMLGIIGLFSMTLMLLKHASLDAVQFVPIMGMIVAIVSLTMSIYQFVNRKQEDKYLNTLLICLATMETLANFIILFFIFN